MPVKVSDIDRLGSVLGLQEIKEPEKTAPTKKSESQKLDQLANVVGLKKKQSSEDSTKPSNGQSLTQSNSNGQSGSSEITTTPTDESVPDNYAFKPLANIYQKESTLLPQPPVKTPRQQLEEAGSDIIARQNATKQSIDIFNQSYGTKFSPEEVLSNPDKASDFLNLYKQKVARADFDINSSSRPQNIIASSESFGQPIKKSAPPIIPDVNLLANATPNENLLTNHVVDLSVDEGRMNGLTKQQVVNNLYKRLDPRGFEATKKAIDDRTNVSTLDVLTGNNPLTKDNTKEFELLNTEKAPYEFAINESLKRQANDMQVMGTLQNNPALIEGGKSIAAQVQSDDDIYRQYPYLNKSRIANEISQELAANSGQLEGTNAEGLVNNINKLRGAFSDPLKTEAFKKYYDNPATRDAALEVASNPDDYISDPSYLGGLGKNIAKPFKELGLSALDIVGVRDKMDRLSDAKNEDLFPEITPGLKGYVNKIKSAVNTTFYLTGMMGLQAVGGGVGSGLGLAAKGAERLGTAMAFGMPSFDANLKDADRWTDNDGVKAAYATLGGMINTVGGEFLELGKISKFQELQKPMLELANKMTDKNITEKAVSELLDKAKNPYVDAVMKYGTNVTKGAAVMSYFTFFNGVNKMLFGGDETSKDLVENTGTAFVYGLLGMSVLGAFGAHADMKKEKNTSYKNNIYQLSQNHDAARDVIETAYKNGQYTRPEYNEKVQILNTAINAKNNLEIADSGSSTPLDESQKAVYVANRTAEGVIKKQLDSPLLTEEQKGTFENQIKRLQTQREEILNGLKFSDNLEPLDVIFKAQQEYKKAYEDFNEGVVYNDSEVIKAKEKLTSAIDIYNESKKPEDQRTISTIEQKEPEVKTEPIAPDNDMSGLSHADWFLKNKDKFSDEEFNSIKDNLARNETEKSKAIESIIAKKEEIKSTDGTKTTEPLQPNESGQKEQTTETTIPESTESVSARTNETTTTVLEPSTVKSEEINDPQLKSKIEEVNDNALAIHNVLSKRKFAKEFKFDGVPNEGADRIKFLKYRNEYLDAVLTKLDLHDEAGKSDMWHDLYERIEDEYDANVSELKKSGEIKSENKPIQNETEKTTEVSNTTTGESASNEQVNKNIEPTSEAENIAKAKELVNSGVVKGYTADVLKDAANNNETEFKSHLKDISEQAQDPKSEKQTIETYGKELVDIANELFPPKEDISSQSKTQPNESNGKEGSSESGSKKGNAESKGGSKENGVQEDVTSKEGGKKEPPQPPSDESGKPKEDFIANDQQRRFTKQVLADEAILPKEEIAKKLDYIRQTNAMTVAEANKVIDEVGVDAAFEAVVNDKEMNPAVRVVLGEMVIKKFNNLASKATDEETKNYYIDKTIEAADFVTVKLATEAGQSIQAFSLYGRLSPEAQMRSAIKDVKEQAKKREEKRRNDVNSIGDKLKKVNEETANEVTNSKDVDSSIDKAEKNRQSKAKDRIKKAREKRQDIIKKYNENKGKNLYSGFGLTNEGIEFVGDIAKTYIVEGIGKAELLIEKIKEHLEEVSKKPITDEVSQQIEHIANIQIANSNIRSGMTDIGEGIKEQKLKINDIIKEHYTVADAAKQSLAEKLVRDAGLEGEDAKELSKTVQESFDKIAKAKKEKILLNEKAKFDRIYEQLSGGKKTTPKSIQDDIIRYSNLGAFDNDGLLKMLSEKLGTGALTPEQGKEIERLADKVQKAPEGSPKNDAVQDLLTYRANLKGTSWAEVAQGVWYANVLSGYLTHVKNIVSTFYNGFTFFATEAARNPLSIPALMYGGSKGLARGLIEAYHTVKTGRSPIHVSKVETPNVLERIRFRGGYLNPANYLKYVGRLMVAEDVIQFQGLKEMRATQLAFREANKEGYKNPFSKETWKVVNDKLLNTKDRLEAAHDQVKEEGLKGSEATRRTYELMEQSRPIQMQEDAYGFAAKGTFNHDTEGTLGALTNAVSQLLDVPVGGVKPLRFLIPFTRIITNVANNTLDFSPIGMVRAARGVRGFESFKRSAAVKNQYHVMTKEERQQTIVKASLGIASMAYLLSQAQSGNIQITGAGPTDIKKKLQLIQEGWQPYSIKVGDSYQSYKLTPMVFAWGIVGSIMDHQTYDKGADQETLAQRTAMATWDGIKNIGDMTWIGSASPIMSALAEGNASKAGTMLSNTGKNTVKGFLIPNIYTQTAEKIEQIYGMPTKQANNLYQSLIMNIPIARNTLNDKINALGDPVVKDVDIVYSDETKDPVWKYLLDKKGWVAPVNRNTLIVYDNKTNQDRPVTDNEYYEFSKVRGQKIKEHLKEIMANGALTTENSKGETVFTTDNDVSTGAIPASQLTSAQLNKLLTPIKTKATKEAKKELYFVKEKEEE